MAQPILAFDVRPDEVDDITRTAATRNIEIITRSSPVSLNALEEMPDTDAISVLGQSILDEQALEKLAERGVKFISTRTVGFDHIDLKAATKLGIAVGHVNYPPNSVAEYAVMLILMSLRRMKLVMHRAQIQDFSLAGSQGRELGNSTVGIVGTGRIGAMVARLIKPFGPKIYATDLYPNKELEEEGVVEYVDLETLAKKCDLISLHAPAGPENHHIISEKIIRSMPPGAMIINCGRGELIDPEALISALEDGHIGGAALDVLENDLQYFHRDVRLGTIRHRNLVLLRSFPQVLVTPHIAFYTQEVVTAMVEQSVDSLMEMRATGESKFKVN